MEKITLADLIGRIVYFDYDGCTEQAEVVGIVTKGTDPVVTISGYKKGGWSGEGLKFRMPINCSKLSINPMADIKELIYKPS